MRQNLKIIFTIEFKSKWHTGSGDGNLSIDKLVRRDARNWPFIPGSTLKGIIRENCEKLSQTLGFAKPSDPHQTDLKIEDRFYSLEKQASPVDCIFGNKYESDCLFFRDARLENKPYKYSKNQSRICKYRTLGTSKEKHLFTSEYTIPMIFKTQINAYHKNLLAFPDELPYAYCILVAGIMKTKRIGGDKSTGSGHVDIQIDSILYNGKNYEKEKIFDLLDYELYKD